jgi:hypothetical protein
VRAADARPEGRHRLRFKFGPAGQPGFTQGNGCPGRAQLYVDGQLIAHNQFPFTTPIADLVPPPEHCHVYQQTGKG